MRPRLGVAVGFVTDGRDGRAKEPLASEMLFSRLPVQLNIVEQTRKSIDIPC